MAENQDNNIHAHHLPEQHAQHESHFLRNLGIGTALVTGAVILAPYVLPHLGISGTVFCPPHMEFTGIAGAIHNAINAVPVIGSIIAKGEIGGALITGAIGIGGVLLGNFLEKKQNGTNGVNWGKVIRYAAITTTMLIAMPTVLTGVTAGLVYLTSAFAPSLTQSAITFLTGTVGSVCSMSSSGLSSSAAPISMGLSHLLSCGSALFPAAATFFMGGDKTQEIVIPIPEKAATKESKINIKIIASEPHQAGKTSKLQLQLTDDLTGKPITPEQLETTHTEKLHLLISDQSLKDYHHIHPTPTNQAGVYEFAFTPNTSNAYHVWADFATIDNKHHNILTEIPASNGVNVPANINYNSEIEKDGLKFKWEAKEPLQKGADSLVEVTVTDSQGKVVDNLEPILGAYAHMVGVSADGQSFIHVHPMGHEPKSPEEKSSGKLQFHIHPEQAGATQFYLQVKHGGKDVTVPFGQQVKQASLSENIVHSHQHHDHHAGMTM